MKKQIYNIIIDNINKYFLRLLNINYYIWLLFYLDI